MCQEVLSRIAISHTRAYFLIKSMASQVIAFYLPQYHPTPNNNRWWGKGFTEWTNVAKAKKLYPGHYQPKIPADLGFYDLRLPQVRELQAKMACEAGVTGFCYYHYWFSDGHEELDLPFKEVVASSHPDFPFCLCWANQSWYSKFWNKDGSNSKRLLAEQLYLGAEDNKAHFYSLLKAFKDKRYITVDGRILFLIYQPFDFVNFMDFKRQWNELAQSNGLKGFYFVAQALYTKDVPKVLSMGFDGVNHCHRIDNPFQQGRFQVFAMRCFKFFKRFVKVPFIVPYKTAIKHCVDDVDFEENVYPTMMPNWDHTPRSSDGGTVVHNSTPELFKRHAVDVLKTTLAKSKEHQIVFLKSWNEWGEGNYMEPDLRYGRGYIDALKRALSEYNHPTVCV